MTGFSEAIQRSVFQALNDSEDLNGLLAKHNRFNRSAIYDRMPQPDDSGNNSLFPLITIGEDNVADWSTDTASGADARVSVHIWSRSPTFSEAKRIAAAVYAALNRAELEFVLFLDDGEGTLSLDFTYDSYSVFEFLRVDQRTGLTVVRDETKEFIGCDHIQDENIRDPDGVTLHVVSDYRFIADEGGYGE